MKVYVMMSTYNGEKYLRQQIDSVLHQKDIEVELRVRDDGSSDSTADILNEYQNAGKLTWFTGKNLRPCESFLELLFSAPEFEYYAFADQDDYWHRDKLCTAVNMLVKAGENLPALYFSAKNIVDEQLRPTGRQDTRVRHVCYGAAILNCVASGCTMVFNREAFLAATSYRPEHATMHDAWLYRVVNAFGTVLYDPVPHMDYRQHGSNVVGADLSMGSRIAGGLHSIGERRKMTYRSEGAAEMLQAFRGKLSPEQEALTAALMNAPRSLKARLKLVFGSGLKAQSFAEIFFIKCFILLGWI